MNKSCCRICIIFLLNATIGCGGRSDGPDTVEVTGEVVYHGQPVAGATVTFQPAGDAGGSVRSAQSLTDAGGKFAMRTYLQGTEYKDGLVPGEYRIGVTKLDQESVAGTSAAPPNLLPAKYADPATSGIQVSVARGETNHVLLELQN